MQCETLPRIILVQQLNVSLVDIWDHGVANGVMSENLFVLQIPQQKVLGHALEPRIEAFEVDQGILADLFEHEHTRVLVYRAGQVSAKFASGSCDGNLRLIPTNCDRVYDKASVVGVIITHDRLIWSVSFHGVASVEEFAYVTPNVLLDKEFAARMVTNKFSHIQN